ncbi:GNAT family N-acetyltransferase [Rhizobium grahamii]|uniref:N-acetyltransferase GCN5 n=1 Tax=Rhizobium grahamii CCGE 502 TaxID=990285 RepID=S3H8U2_9HYPH|nr:GNAT family N-acetyltransferase [Rhizobium grahamii]EPE95292.1 N-acetyltransferase GCN5 [Rhizobium grahamii CCGE 502]
MRRGMQQPDIIRLEAKHMRDAAMLRRLALWGRLPWLPDVHTPEEDEAYWRTQLLPNRTILGAVSAQRLVAIIAYGENEIDQLYVLPDFQANGIGTMLLRRAQEEMDEIELWTFQRNTSARRFYERHGFVAMKETDGAGNEEREPDVLYRWRRPPSLSDEGNPSDT